MFICSIIFTVIPFCELPCYASDVSSVLDASISQPVIEVAQKNTDLVQKWWESLLFDIIFGLFIPIFVPVLAVLVFWLTTRLGLKVQLETLDKIAQQASEYAEKKGAQYFNEHGKKSTGAKKSEWAWSLIDQIDDKIKGKEKLKNIMRGLLLAKIPDAEARVNRAEVLKKEATK